MSTVKFVHCADLHLDTPFRGLANVAPEIAAELNEATFKSYDNIIDLAIRERVDFVVIAGDVYESSDKSLRAQFRFRDGLRRLSDNGIESFIAFGNHDPLNGWSHTIDWPEGAHFFGSHRVDNWQVTRAGNTVASVHGISFDKDAVTDDLAAEFEAPTDSMPSIAVLHCNVGGQTGHDNYAPTTIEELSAIGFDYWALGHVHAHRILRADGPAIVYPGCSQSRHPNETGPRGCCVVSLGDGAPPDVRFEPTDTVRYYQGPVDISALESQDHVLRALAAKCHAVLDDSHGKKAIARLTLAGRTRLHRELARGSDIEALLQAVRMEVEGWEPWVWLEKLVLNTRGDYDIDGQRGREDFVGDLMSVYDELLRPLSDHLVERRTELEDALSPWQGYRFLKDSQEQPIVTTEELATIAEQARGLTLDQLVEEP